MARISNKRISEWVEEIDAAARHVGVDPKVAATDLVSELTQAQVRELAAKFLTDEVARRRRAETLTAERDAQRAPWLSEAVSNPSAATPAQREASQEIMERWAEEDRLVQERTRRDVANIMERYLTAKKVEWTTELLDSAIAMPDGTIVLWGDATVEQHQERRDMFLRNALANTEGAARHEQAIRELTEAGTPTLREMVSVNG